MLLKEKMRLEYENCFSKVRLGSSTLVRMSSDHSVGLKQKAQEIADLQARLSTQHSEMLNL